VRRPTISIPRSLLLLAVLAPGAAASETELFDRALGRCLDRVQTELQRSTELWEDHSTWENAWRVRSEHYEVVTTRSRFHGASIAQGLETMLGHFKALLSPDFEPNERFVVYVYPTIAGYNGLGQQGDEHSSFYGSFYAQADAARPVATLDSDNWTLLNMWITHSAFHQFLDRAFTRQPPLWVSEGLASYFALFWNHDYGVSELRRIAANQPVSRRTGPPPPPEYVPLAELLSASLPDYMVRSHNRLIELGMLFSYLLNYREDTRTVIEDGSLVREPFAAYLRLLLDGREPRTGPIAELLGGGPRDLEIEFLEFDFGG